MEESQKSQQSKICSKCEQVKPLSDFYKLPRNRLASWCKQCTREGSRKGQILRKEQLRKKSILNQIQQIKKELRKKRKQLYSQIKLPKI